MSESSSSTISPQLAQFEALGDASPFVARMEEIIEQIRLFEDFESAEIAEVAQYLQCFRAPTGAEIIRENDPGDFMLLLLEGTTEIVRKANDGMPVRIGLAWPGKTLGEMSLIDGEPRFASCVAIEPVMFGVLDRTALSHIIADKPKLGIKLMMQLLQLLNQRLRLVSAELVRNLGQKAVRGPIV